MLTNKAFIEVLSKYLDDTYVFSFDFMMELRENTGINKHVIKLIEDKQLLYGLIYSLGSEELETLQTYIQTHLKTGFIPSSKCPAGISIYFNQKLNESPYFYVD